MELIVPSGAVAKNIPVKVDVVPRVDFEKQTAGDSKAAAAAFSSSLKLLSPVYSLDTRGNAVSQAIAQHSHPQWRRARVASLRGRLWVERHSLAVDAQPGSH